MASLSKDMSTGREAKNLVVFAAPLFLSYFLQALYGSVDTIIVGQFAHLGDVAGVTQGSQVMHILTQAVSGLSTGAVVLISRYLGAKRDKDLKETVHTLFSLFACAALACSTLIIILDDPLIRLIGLDKNAAAPMRSYLKICGAGMLFVFFYNCISAVLQALGDSRHPLIFVGIACVINVILDLVFVAYLGMGAAGAAFATVLAQGISVVLSVGFLRRRNFVFDFRLKSFAITKDKLKLLLQLGIPYALQRTVVASSFLAISGLSNSFGLAAGSASGVVSKINNFATMPFTAMATAITTAAGQNIGANRLDRGKKSLWIGASISFGVGACLFSLVQFFPEACLSMFSTDPELLAVGVGFLRFYSIEYLLMPFTFSVNGFLSATGHTWMPLVNGLVASLLLRVPLAILFAKLIGFSGIALGSSLAVLGAVCSCFLFYFSGKWRREVIPEATNS